MDEMEALRKAVQERDRRIAELEQENATLRARVRELEQKLEEALRAAKRQAAPFSKGPPKENPKKPGRKPGEQYGEPARREPPGKVDEIVSVPHPPQCDDCGGPVEFVQTVHQYQEEIPRKPIRRRFDIEVGRCRRCGKRVPGRHPKQTSDALGAAQAQLGPDAQALVAELKENTGVSYGDVAHLFDRVWGIELSRGGAAQIVLRTGERRDVAYRGIQIVVRRSRVVTMDETGWKVGGVLQWLWTAVARTATLFRILPGRGQEELDALIGLNYSGVAEHDGWAPYEALTQAIHQQCNGHLVRRCEGLREISQGPARRFPQAVLGVLRAGLRLRDRREAGEISPHGLAIATGKLEAKLYELVTRPYRHPENRRLARHLGLPLEEIFTYLRRAGVEATTWRVDRASRYLIANRKVFGGNREWTGARALERIGSVAATCRQRGVDFLEYLRRVLCAPVDRRDLRACRLLELPLPP